MSIPDTEQGRIARVVRQARACEMDNALTKARAMYGTQCLASSNPVVPSESVYVDGVITYNPVVVPSESTYLDGVVTPCYTFKGPDLAVPESVRIARLTQMTIDQNTNPFNTDTRFAGYRRGFFPVLCPPIPQAALNANVPKNLGQTCPLPNKPFNVSYP